MTQLFNVINYVIVKMFIIRGARLVKLLTMLLDFFLELFFRKAFTRFDFTGDCQQTRVELCACTSDRERCTRAGEACTSDRQPVNANPDSDSCLCERSIRVSARLYLRQHEIASSWHGGLLGAILRQNLSNG